MYYTYAYLREDRTPYYIGKGKGRRVHQKHNGFYPPSKDRILLLKQNLIEDEAFRHEVYMISVFGRKDLGTGILHNKTNGGKGCSAKVMNDIDIYNRKKGRLGKSLTEVHKKRIGESNKGVSRNFFERKNQLAKEIKNKPEMNRKGKIHSKETKLKISEATQGRVPWNKGIVDVNVSGGKNPRAKRIKYNNIVYDCIKTAVVETKKSRYHIQKYGILLDAY